MSNYLLSDNSIQNYDIVIYDTSSIIQKFAAKELQHYLKKIFGKTIPIKTKYNIQQSKHFLLGLGFVNDSLFSTDTLSKYALIEGVENGNVYLGGHDPKIESIETHFRKAADTAIFGSLYATYDWLESELGVHWFFPTYLGEYVPGSDSVDISNSIQIVVPKFTEGTFRTASMYHDQDTLRTWMLRNKVKNSRARSYNHNWKNIVPQETYFDEHPKYFAKWNGNRRRYDNPAKTQLCTTNEELIQVFVNNVRKYLENNKQFKSISVTPNDSRHFCQCINCQSLDTTYNIDEVWSAKSNRIFSFYKRIADSILKYYPTYNIGGHAYTDYTLPTKSFDLSDQFHIRIALNYFGLGNDSCSSLQSLKMIVNEWGKCHDNLGFYSFPYPSNWPYPAINSELFQEVLISLDNNQIQSSHFAFYPEWYSQGLDIWLISKMYWNPQVKIDSLKDIYYRTVFPNSGSIIRKYHNSVTKGLESITSCIYRFMSVKKQIPNIFLEVYDYEVLIETEKELWVKLNNNSMEVSEINNVKNILLTIEFLLLEHNSYKKYDLYNIVPNNAVTISFNKVIENMRNSVCITNKSIYFDPNRSPSLNIRN